MEARRGRSEDEREENGSTFKHRVTRRIEAVGAQGDGAKRRQVAQHAIAPIEAERVIAAFTEPYLFQAGKVYS